MHTIRYFMLRLQQSRRLPFVWARAVGLLVWVVGVGLLSAVVFYVLIEQVRDR